MRKISPDHRNFKASLLAQSEENQLHKLAQKCRGDILKMTTLAGSGHPGGSMSSIDTFVTLYSFANIDPHQPDRPDRDLIVISHGHTSPGVYSTLGNIGFFPVDEVIAHFRQAGGPFEGHVEQCLPGVEWTSGNLGQGLSAGCGFTLNSRIHNVKNQVFVLMGDGEQQKGQISEARRFAVKYGLTNLTCLVDLNHLQICGRTDDIMPQNIRENFISDGWRVIEIDGHNFQDIYHAFHQAVSDRENCVAIIAKTTMGKGVSRMENDCKWHGQALSDDLLTEALAELDLSNDLDRYRELRSHGTAHLVFNERPIFHPKLEPGEPTIYASDHLTDNRSAWGKALEDISRLNMNDKDATPLAVFDCDLTGSVKTSRFSDILPEHFFQAGIMEHHTAVAAGALSIRDVQVFWADFGVFGIDEVYNQMRINDINETHLKLICTHLGIDVGEDGKTHHCTDYLGLLRNLFNFKTVIPADPNQMDRVVRWVAGQPGNVFIGMGRSKVPVITKRDGTLFFDENYKFDYGKADILRSGQDISVVTMGGMVHRAVRVADELMEEGVDVAVFNFSCAKDLDPEALSAACKTGILVTYEDHNVNTGLGAAVSDCLFQLDLKVELFKMGIPHYATSGKPSELLDTIGLDENSLKYTLRRLMEKYKHPDPNGADLESTLKLP